VGAAKPAVIDEHTPVGAPVRIMVHAWQVLLHAVLQQNPSTQLPWTHWLPAVQGVPSGRRAHIPLGLQ
jgi:hypothetical protein